MTARSRRLQSTGGWDSCFIHLHYMWDMMLNASSAGVVGGVHGRRVEALRPAPVRPQPDETWLIKCKEYANIL